VLHPFPHSLYLQTMHHTTFLEIKLRITKNNSYSMSILDHHLLSLSPNGVLPFWLLYCQSHLFASIFHQGFCFIRGL